MSCTMAPDPIHYINKTVIKSVRVLQHGRTRSSGLVRFSKVLDPYGVTTQAL